jgi:hypothetical protein
MTSALSPSARCTISAPQVLAFQVPPDQTPTKPSSFGAAAGKSKDTVLPHRTACAACPRDDQTAGCAAAKVANGTAAKILIMPFMFNCSPLVGSRPSAHRLLGDESEMVALTVVSRQVGLSSI